MGPDFNASKARIVLQLTQVRVLSAYREAIQTSTKQCAYCASQAFIVAWECAVSALLLCLQTKAEPLLALTVQLARMQWLGPALTVAYVNLAFIVAWECAMRVLLLRLQTKAEPPLALTVQPARMH